MTGAGEGDHPACTIEGRKVGETPGPVFPARGAKPLRPPLQLARFLIPDTPDEADQRPVAR